MSRKFWRYKAGQKRINRVTVREARISGTIRMEWYKGGRHFVATGTHSKERAIVMCEAKADELMAEYKAAQRAKRERGDVLVRLDMVRVARELGIPEGYAPPITAYRSLGRYSTVRVRIVGGMRNRNPILQWCGAVTRYGLKPYRRHYHPTPQMLVADLRRVALKLGHPAVMPTLREYRDHGMWTTTTVRRQLAPIWADVARSVGLAMLPVWRSTHSTKANHGSERRTAA